MYTHIIYTQTHTMSVCILCVYIKFLSTQVFLFFGGGTSSKAFESNGPVNSNQIKDLSKLH